MQIVLLLVLLYYGYHGTAQQAPPAPPNGTVPSPPAPTATPGAEKLYRYENNTFNRDHIANILLTGCDNRMQSDCPKLNATHAEMPGFDGWYNNLDRPDSGAIDGHLLRRTPAAYGDGTYSIAGQDRPNPFNLSDQLLALENDYGSQSRTGKTALLVFFGQQVVEEILDAQRPACPPEYINIKIPDGHRYRALYNHTEMPVLRTRYDQRTGYTPNNPRQQLNEITPYLDGGLMYGITKQWADSLRTYRNGSIDETGRLASSHGGLFPEYNIDRLPLANPPPPFHHADFIKDHEIAKVSRFFKLGNPRGNENTFLLTFGVLWFRWHNYLADNIRRLQPIWSGERIFNEARKWVIATQQHIVIDEWLPSWVNKSLGSYSGYDPSVNPQIDQLFQTAAFRFGHTLVTPGVYLRDYGRNGCSTNISSWTPVRTCNAFWRPQDAIKTKYSSANDDFVDIDRVLMGLAMQLTEEEDHKIVEDLRGNVFGPLEFPRRDLMAVNIQRGRDHGIPDFNTAREAFNLPRITSFDHFTASADVKKKMRDLYNGSLDNIDVWVGGIMETKDGPGELFEAIILDQFRRIRSGDRFWYENEKNKLFTRNEIERLKKLTLYDIIMCVTKMDYNDIQPEVFKAPTDLTRLHPNCTYLQNKTCSQCAKWSNGRCIRTTRNFPCHFLPQLNRDTLKEQCVQGAIGYDYFSNSAVSFILSYLGVGLIIAMFILSVYLLMLHKGREKADMQIQNVDNVRKTLGLGHDDILYVASEWVGKNHRPVILKCVMRTKQLQVMSRHGKLLRALDLSDRRRSVSIFNVANKNYVIIKLQNDYDLALRFENQFFLDTFLGSFKQLLTDLHIEPSSHMYLSLKTAFETMETYDRRKEKLSKFFRVVFAQAFHIDYPKDKLLEVDTSFNEIAKFELTLFEFAEALGMRSDQEFVQRIFTLIDKDRNNFISFREFTDLLVIFAKGTEKDKAKLLFDMYDINAVGYLTRDNFTAMIKSFLETVGGSIDQQTLDKTIENMLESVGLRNKQKLQFNDFLILVGDDINKLNKATLGFKGVTEHKYIDEARETIENLYESHAEIQARIQGQRQQENFSEMIDNEQEIVLNKVKSVRPNMWKTATSYIENNVTYLFWATLYTLVLIAIFAERAYHYSFESEDGGLRQIAGYGVTVTRGAASAMMFTYSSLLVTMAKNTISALREISLGQYLPLDTVVDLHKYIAVCALISSLIHIVGHAFNFYHISTQTSDDLTCLFRNYFHSTHEIPKFHYWAWETITGFTGIVLTVIAGAIFVFSLPIVRQRLYNWFWYIHSLYPLFFIFMVLHGAGRLVQEPFFHYFFLPPVILFVIDKLISVRRKKVQIPVLNAKIWPSNVTMLQFTKPLGFTYKSGQYVRISCAGLNPNEYHPFTLSSSPDEQTLSVHIRAVGPWTTHIRKLYDDALATRPLPQIFLDGPYGEGHQDWYQHEVSILIGAGIGVTPFASILKDIVFKSNINYQFQCKKVYFIWVARTQRQFEWMVDILSEVEKSDKNGIVSAHIFITQFYEKFDLRTVLLYICERHYQKISQKSLFTSLQAVTHFGRPSFPEFFKTVQSLHSKVVKIGVFSCGSPPVVSAVESACFRLNESTASGPIFIHSYKSF